MKAEDIKVGMWLRHKSGSAWRVKERVASGQWAAVDPSGLRGLLEEEWVERVYEPWSPRVGEWVRDSMTGVTREVASMWESHGTWWSSGDGVYGRVSDSEPCLPPAPPTTYLRADGVEMPAKVEFKPVQVRYADDKSIPAGWEGYDEAPEDGGLGANSTCPKCGGPAYLGLQEARCLAPRCERVEPEPEVEVGWRAPQHHEPPSDNPEWLAWCRGHERVHVASGLGHSAQHPIREEAIRLWREAVRRG